MSSFEPVPFVGEEMDMVRISVPASHMVFFRAILEAHEGLAQIYAEKGGRIVVATTKAQYDELRWVLRELAEELPLAFA